MLPQNPVNVLVVGGGGREHAICWKLAQSSKVQKIYCAPGNGGTARTDKTQNIEILVSEFDKLAQFCADNEVDLVVIGPDNPLAEGIVDFLAGKELRVFGPLKEAAQIEWSKAFAKRFMSKNGMPTARYIDTADRKEALEFARKNDWARVVKVDGLALGKGVFVCDSIRDVEDALAQIFDKKAFGDAGTTVLIEERLTGEEMSLLFFCDGKKLVAMPASQDHKRRFDQDAGPNTGGMGAYAPVALYDRCADQIKSSVVAPFERALQSGDIKYCGIVYAGLMVTPDNKPYVLEFNARFGDPETQVLLPLLTGDLLEIFWQCVEGDLAPAKVTWSDSFSCCVVAAGESYPASSSRGETISIGLITQDTIVFHAGTKLKDGKLSNRRWPRSGCVGHGIRYGNSQIQSL